MIADFLIKILSFGYKGSKEKTPELNYGRHLIKEFLGKSMPFQRVLDLGAGTGDDLMAARRINSNAELHAAETFQPNLKTLLDLNINVHKINIECEKLPFPDESMDIIIANQILEHTKEIFWIFHESSRILPVGGTIILGVPNLAALHNRILLLLGRQPSPLKTASAHVRGFTRQDITQFLNSCFPGGYHIEGFGGSNFYPFPPAVARPLAKLFPNAAWGIFLMLKKTKPYDREFLDYPVENQLETNFFINDSDNTGQK